MFQNSRGEFRLQLYATDYYELGDDGCCLICEDSEDGCLCYDCKCKKCYWYSYNEYLDEGSCDLAEDFKYQSEINSEFCDVGPISILSESVKACLISFIDGREGWIPKQCIQNNRIQRWLLMRKGFEDLIITSNHRSGSETIRIGLATFSVMDSFTGQSLKPGEIVAIDPKSGRLLIVR